MAGEPNKPALDDMTAKPQLSFADLMPRVASEYGKPLAGQLKDMLGLCLRGNRLTVDEYYDLCLFDDATYDAEAKKRFVGLHQSRQLWLKLMSVNRYLGLLDDKLAYEKFMRAFGFAVPDTLAITGGHYPSSVRRIASADDLKDFLKGTSLPLFGKPVHSNQSLGSAKLEAYDSKTEQLTLASGTCLSADDLWEEIVSKFDGDYLFQTCIAPHKTFSEMCQGGVPTMRLVTLDCGSGPQIYRAVAKLTGGGNVADNFWREGNLVATIDTQTGVLGKALNRKGIDGAFLSNHPVTGKAIEGVQVPFWQEACATAKTAMRLLPGVAILGFDIAITAQGPVIIEANKNPDFGMLQITHREGVLDETMRQALDHVSAMQSREKQETKDALEKERLRNKEDMKQAVSRKAA